MSKFDIYTTATMMRKMKKGEESVKNSNRNEKKKKKKVGSDLKLALGKRGRVEICYRVLAVTTCSNTSVGMEV